MSYFSNLFVTPCKKIVSRYKFFWNFCSISCYCSRWDVRFVFSANRLEGWMQIYQSLHKVISLIRVVVSNCFGVSRGLCIEEFINRCRHHYGHKSWCYSDKGYIFLGQSDSFYMHTSILKYNIPDHISGTWLFHSLSLTCFLT